MKKSTAKTPCTVVDITKKVTALIFSVLFGFSICAIAPFMGKESSSAIVYGQTIDEVEYDDNTLITLEIVMPETTTTTTEETTTSTTSVTTTTETTSVTTTTTETETTTVSTTTETSTVKTTSTTVSTTKKKKTTTKTTATVAANASPESSTVTTATEVSSGKYNGLPITQSEFIMLANLVAHEYGANWVPTKEKAKVVMTVMNRVRSSKFPNTVKKVILQKNQYCWVPDSYYWKRVTQDCKDAVTYYFNHQSEFSTKLYSFYGTGKKNIFY